MSTGALVRGLAMLALTLAACHDYRVLEVTDGGDAHAPTDVDGADAPAPVDGAAQADGTAGTDVGGCAERNHVCGGACKSDTDVSFCGPTCEHCTVPQNGSAVCNGSCGVKCDTNFNLCGTSCKASTDPNACGPDCIRCDAPTGGSATCDGTKCGAPTCPMGQKICNNACIDAARSCNGVCSNGKYSCPDGVCRDTTVVTSCGTGCQPCAAKPNATATSCTGGTCGYACNTGFLLCGDGSCGRSKWDFETGDAQTVYATLQDNGTLETTSVRTDHVHSGTYALAGHLLQGDNFYFVTFTAPICGGTGKDLTGKNVSAWVYVDAPNTSPYVCIDTPTTTGTCVIAAPNTWTRVSGVATGVWSTFVVEVMGAGPWNGRVYVDDIEIAP